MLPWLSQHAGNIIKGIAVTITAVSFFASLKIDVAVSQADIANIKATIAELKGGVKDTNAKVDQLYDLFVNRYAHNGQ